MTNYNNMSVHELISEAYSDGIDVGKLPDHLEKIELALRKAVIREESAGTCEWEENEDGMWETSCENAFVFEEGGPEENGQKFCCYCGNPLKAVPFVYPTEDGAV
jgi:hypothetical protein